MTHTAPVAEVLRLGDLRKSYRSPEGTTELVIDVPAFAMAAGGQVALRGVSGSGKTTLLNLVAGILTPDSGTVVVHGRDMARLPEAARDAWRADTIGYVFQTFNLLQAYTARVAVARAMGNRPRLVLADEPTGNLDPRHAAEALELIRATCREQQAALLLVSHDPNVLATFDRVDDLAVLNRAAGARVAA